MSRAQRYKTLGDDYHWQWWVSRPDYRQWIGRLLSEFPRDANNATVLDIGCGDGVPASQLMARGFEVVCYDELEGPLSVAQTKIPNGTFVDEIPDEDFDFILVSEGIRNFSEDERVINAILNCRQYAVVTAAQSAHNEYTLGRMFPKCDVELIFTEDDLRAFIIEPQRV